MPRTAGRKPRRTREPLTLAGLTDHWLGELDNARYHDDRERIADAEYALGWLDEAEEEGRDPAWLDRMIRRGLERSAAERRGLRLEDCVPSWLLDSIASV